MSKFIQIVLFVALIAVCYAEPARLNNVRRSKFSARQELAEDIPAQTPYPPAGIIPEVRFSLPTEEEEEEVAIEPDNTYLPPDNVGGLPAQTYGPPEVTNDGETVEDEEVDTDQTEQPEVLEQPQEPKPLNAEVQDNEIENPQSERLVLRRSSSVRSGKLQIRPSTPLRAQRLVAAPVPLRSQRLVAQPIYFANGRFFTYSPQFPRL